MKTSQKVTIKNSGIQWWIHTDLAFKLWIVSTRFYAVTAYFSRRDLVWPRARYITQPSPHLKGQICSGRLGYSATKVRRYKNYK